jgi:type I restriction enzyme S subunit
MKQGWEIKAIGDVCKVIAGQSPEGKYYNDNGNGLPFYQGKKEYGSKYIGEPKTWTTKVTKEAEADDVLMSVRAPVGPINFATQNICIGRGLAAIRATKLIDKEFLFNFLLKHESEIVGNSGAVFNSINKAQIEAIEILLPPLPEQQRIVAILETAFTAISKAKANAEQNLKNAKELFESLVVEIFNDGIRIKKWNLEKLEKYNKVVVGYVGPISKEYTNDEAGVLLLSTKNIGNKGVSLVKLTRINPQFHQKNKKSQLVPGDILVARHGNSGQAAVIPDTIREAHALNVIIIKRSETLSSEYISFLLNSGVLDKIAASKGGSVQEIINTSVIKNLTIPVPSLNEQKIVVQKLEATLLKTKRLEAIYQQKLNDLEELKKSVLQKAFAGELKTEKELV